MRKLSFLLLWTSCLIVVAFAGIGVIGEEAYAGSKTPAESAEGLWKYTTLARPGGAELQLTGLFLIKEGWFAQQSIFDAEPFEEQVAMAHAGTYEASPKGIDLVAEQTVTVSPKGDPPLSSRGRTEHELSVTRSGDKLTLVFGSGTVQEFERVGDGSGKIYSLADGLLAFVSGYFFLVEADQDSVTSGYGTFEKNGNSYDLRIIRWAETEGEDLTYRRDGSLEATFDGKVLVLPDGQSFRVAN
jgi:hypothetical protein